MVRRLSTPRLSAQNSDAFKRFYFSRALIHIDPIFQIQRRLIEYKNVRFYLFHFRWPYTDIESERYYWIPLFLNLTSDNFSNSQIFYWFWIFFSEEFLGDDFGDPSCDDTYTLGNEEEEILLAGGNIDCISRNEPKIEEKIDNSDNTHNIVNHGDADFHNASNNTIDDLVYDNFLYFIFLLKNIDLFCWFSLFILF